MAEIGKTDTLTVSAIQSRTDQAEKFVSLARAAKGNPPRSIDIDGVGIRADRVAVAASGRFASQVEALGQAAANASEAASVLDVADAALTGIDTRLDRMEELADIGARTEIERDDGSRYTPAELSERERAILNTEFTALRDEIDTIAADTEFNGTYLLSGDPVTPSDPLQMNFQTGIGTGASDTVTVSLNPADAAMLSTDLETASLLSESNSDTALTAVEEAQGSVDDIQAAVRGARAQLNSVETAAGEVSAVVDKVREVKATPEAMVELSRVVASQVAEEGEVFLAQGAQQQLQEVLMRMSSATANGGPPSGGDGVEQFGGKTSGAPAAAPATTAEAEPETA